MIGFNVTVLTPHCSWYDTFLVCEQLLSRMLLSQSLIVSCGTLEFILFSGMGVVTDSTSINE